MRTDGVELEQAAWPATPDQGEVIGDAADGLTGDAAAAGLRIPGREAIGTAARHRRVAPGRPARPLGGGAPSRAGQPPASTGGSSAVATSASDGDQLVARLAGLIGPAAYERYFSRGARLELDERGLHVRVVSAFLINIFEQRFRPQLEELAGGAAVRFTEDASAFPAEADPPAEAMPPRSPAPAEAPSRRASKPADRAPRLADFVVGGGNRLAYAAACAAGDPTAEPPGGNLLVLHGGCGLGKTHLLRGIARAFGDAGGVGRARYVTAESFTNGFLAALRTKATDAFREQYRGVSLLCLDDVHFLATKDATKAELLHTLDQILHDGARLVLASDEHPREVTGLGKQLCSRLSSGLIVELSPPDDELRLAMVHRLARRRGLTLPAEVAQQISHAVSHGDAARVGSFRDLEGALARVEAFHNLLTRDAGAAGARADRRADAGVVAMSTVTQALGRRRPIVADAPVRVEEVITRVCEVLGVGSAEFAGRGRHRRVVLARALVARLSRELTASSYPEIATAMGRPNHSSVITAVRRIEKQIQDCEIVGVGCPLDGEPIEELSARIARSLRSRSG
ncbi:MAG: DnaA/Hda family protein [Planctomycetota bacterium]